MAGSICCNGMAGNVKKNSWESQERAGGVDKMKHIVKFLFVVNYRQPIPRKKARLDKVKK
ncbi:MAG: hypothetical protein II171_01390 [Bacteroidales bacterium]|nr:hypothetical protein [Bacteroidales bacterium]